MLNRTAVGVFMIGTLFLSVLLRAVVMRLASQFPIHGH